MKISKTGNCPTCGGKDDVKEMGTASGNKYPEAECQACGEWFKIKIDPKVVSLKLDKKLIRAGEILDMAFPVIRNKDDSTNKRFFVRSQSDKQKYYAVEILDDRYQKWKCGCIDFDRHVTYDLEYKCKHCIAVAKALNDKRKLRSMAESEVLL